MLPSSQASLSCPHLPAAWGCPWAGPQLSYVPAGPVDHSESSTEVTPPKPRRLPPSSPRHPQPRQSQETRPQATRAGPAGAICPGRSELVTGRRRRSRCCPQKRPGEAAPAPASRRGSLKAEYEVAEEGARRDPPSQAWGWREERATAGEATRTDGWACTHAWGAEGPGRGPAEKQEGAPADRRGGCGPRRPENPRTCSAQLRSSVA